MEREEVDSRVQQGWAAHLEGRLDAAEACCREVLGYFPEHPGALGLLGRLAIERGDPGAALGALKRAVAGAPEAAEHQVAMGHAYRALGEKGPSEACFRKALSLDPDSAEGHGALGALLLEKGDLPEAETHLRARVRLQPDDPLAHTELGNCLRRQSDWEGAITAFERALALDPAREGAVARLAHVMELKGDLEGAMTLLAPLMEGGTRDVEVVLMFATLCARLEREEEAIRLVEPLLADDRLPAKQRHLLHHRVADLYHGREEYRAAFDHYRRGNRAQEASFDPRAHRAWVDDMIATFQGPSADGLPQGSNDFELPVFIVGMPRSGTSLVEQIIATHPMAEGAGELDDIHNLSLGLGRVLNLPEPYPLYLPRLTAPILDQLAEIHVERLRKVSADARIITDKMPRNFLHLGLIQMLFPRARIIHCVRDPLDTCLSCFCKPMPPAHAFSNDLTHLGIYFLEYRRLMAHWQAVLDIPIMNVSYEELVEDQERVSRELIDFVGLPWDDACLDYHRSTRHVATFSYHQVQKPIYRSAVGRWKHYAPYLGPLMEVLDIKPEDT